MVAGLAAALGMLPWGYSIVSGRWFTSGQQAKWEARYGRPWSPNMIRLMGLGGVLVLAGMMLAVVAIAGLQQPETVVPVGLGLVAIGTVVSS
jgi:hypothetical protein